MKKIVSTAAAVAVAVAGLALVPATSAEAATHCVYTPQLPHRVSIHQSVVGLRTPLRVAGTGCTADFVVSTQLVHSSDSYYMMWDGHGPDVESVYAFEVKPGTYRTTASDCSAYTSNYRQLSCSVARRSTVIKFASRPKLTMTRTGSTVTFHAVTTRYFDYDGFRPVTNTVAIQRRVGAKWVLVHRGLARGKAGYTWSYRRARTSTYRAVSYQTSSTWSGTSRPGTR